MAIDRRRQPSAQRLSLGLLVAGAPAWVALTRAGAFVQGLTGALIAAACASVVTYRVRSRTQEREVWIWWAAALVALSLGFVGNAVVSLVQPSASSTHGWRSLPFGLCALVGCVAAYQGLMRWNRLRTTTSNVGDWLNGIGSVFVAVAMGNLILEWTSSPLQEWPWWQVQAWLLRVAVILILAGSAITVAMIGDLVRDLRAWVISAALLVILGGEVASALGTSPTFAGRLAQLGWLLGAIAIAGCAVRTAEDRAPQAATMESMTAGVLAVLTVSALALVLNNFTHAGSRMPTVYAVLAFLCAAAQGAHIVRALSHLAKTRLEARSDELTGLANRRELLARLGDLINARTSMALLVVDLDRFKVVNDRFGHTTGDELLRLAAERLQAQMPDRAVLARLGGDEFAVLLGGTSTQDSSQLAAVLVDTLSAPFEINGQAMTVGASIGIATLPGPTSATLDDADEDLLRRADVAMYRAKRAGGGVSIYDLEVDTEAREQDLRLVELRAVLAESASDALRGQLVVHYQPQVDVVSGDVTGVEALVRWEHPRLGLLAPGAFLGLAESHGLIGQLTAHVLRVATTQAVNWRIAGHPVRMSVNLSPSFLTSAEIVPMIDRILFLTPIDPSALTLEITETSLMSDPELALQTTREIAARGISVSIDDFGTGYSSLSYLNDLPATELKLDRSFTSRLATDERTSAIVAGTIQLAHHLGLRVIAEGVEDQAALNVLRALDCDEVQGYLCGRPMPVAELDSWFREHGHSPSDTAAYL